MNISLRYLSDFIKLPALSENPKMWTQEKEAIDALADRLSGAGLEIESIDYLAYDIKRVVTGQIKAIDKHPDADRLVVCQLDCATYNNEIEGEDTIQIVTGATNIQVGDIVPVALHQSVLAGGVSIKRSKLRGVRSHGMLCSLSELGLTDEADGIWILPKDVPLGEEVADIAGLKDCVFDVAILPNRGDTASYLGVARELSALYDIPLISQDLSYDLDDKIKQESPIGVDVKDSDAAPLYMGAYLSGFKPEIRTPLYLEVFLYRSGASSISLPVDITNYCCLALGSPMHAFDADDIRGNKLIIKRLKSAEKAKGLDGVERSLKSGDLCVCDESRVLALAGVMGSQAGSVTQKTTDIFLEAAFFEPAEVRKLASQYHLKTESSFRFERAIDPNGVCYALKKALSLFESLAGVSIQSVVSKKDETQACFKAQVINADKTQISNYTSLKLKEGLAPLKRLGFKLEGDQVIVPSWRRFDCEAWPDLAEELLRLEGFEGIEASMPATLLETKDDEPIEALKQQLLNLFVESGFHQVINYSMIDEASVNHLNLEAPVALQNPMSPKQALMRPALLPGLLKTLSFNIKRGFEHGGFVEEGLVFPKFDQQIHKLEAIGLGCIARSDDLKKSLTTFSDLRFIKGIIERIEKQFRIDIELKREALPDYLEQGLSLFVAGECLGCFGVLKADVLKAFNIKKSVSYVSLSLPVLHKAPKQELSYKAFSNFPSIRCDLACLVEESLVYSDIEHAIAKHKTSLCVDHFLFDAYQGPKLPEGKKSLGISFIYQSMERTLTDCDVQPLHTALCDQLKDDLNLEFR